MRIALIGDVHGELTLLARLVERAAQAGVEAAIQLGDFGFFPEQVGDPDAMPQFAIPVHALCGNHEDHRFLIRAQQQDLFDRWRERNLIYQPRASVARLGRLTVGFLGGALHVDRPQRRVHGNVIAAKSVIEAAALFDRIRPLVIATHSCPAGIGVGLESHPAFAWGVAEHMVLAGYDPGPQDDCGETALADLWRRLSHRPRLWCFGHFHQHHDRIVEEVRFLCRPEITVDAPLAILSDQDVEVGFLGA